MTKDSVKKILEKAADRYLLVTLSISQWWGWANDAEVTEEVIRNAGADRSAGYFKKRIMYNTATVTINRIAQAAWREHYRMTKSWNGKACGVITAERFYREYAPKMQELKDEFDRAVDRLLKDWSDYVNGEAERLQGFFKIEDYPTVSTLRHRFSFRVIPDPLPVEDFRMSVPDDVVERLCGTFEERTQSRVEEVVRQVCHGAYERIDKMVEILKTHDPQRIRDSQMEHVAEKVMELREMNITNDPEVDSFCRKIEALLADRSPDLLRSDEAERKKTIKEANAILKAMGGYVGVAA